MHKHQHRVLDLDAAFAAPRMKDVWKRTVRRGMRDQILPDLHDYLDVHRNLDDRVRQIRSNIIAGTFRPQAPEVVRLEKRDGISRRLLIPSPADALVLQTLVEWFEMRLLAAKPTGSAFYSRSHAVRGPENLDETFDYPWWKLWPQFQDRIWKFSEARQYTVVTDLANYFDSIPLAGLRNIIASLGVFEQSLLDFLFFMLEAFVWRPFYVPNSGVGLPQIDFDAPRLLAHGYLFPADRYLSTATKGDFVRWMDDIDFGVDSMAQARSILGELESQLNSFGLRLNAGKTRILSPERAAAHFWVQENRQITVGMNLLESAKSRGEEGAVFLDYFATRYARFKDLERQGNWEKVQKRYFSLFGRFNDPALEDEVPAFLENQPGLRSAIFGYYGRLGYSPERLDHLVSFVLGGHCTDDASLFGAINTIVEWSMPHEQHVLGKLCDFAHRAVLACGETVAAVVAAFLVLAKFGTEIDREKFVDEMFDVWSKSQWASRQIAAATPLFAPVARTRIRLAIVRRGLHEGVAVLTHLDQIAALEDFDAQLRAYMLHPPTKGWNYPFAKVILGLVLLEGRLHAERRTELRRFFQSTVTDPVYRAVLRLGPLPPSLPFAAGDALTRAVV